MHVRWLLWACRGVGAYEALLKHNIGIVTISVPSDRLEDTPVKWYLSKYGGASPREKKDKGNSKRQFLVPNQIAHLAVSTDWTLGYNLTRYYAPECSPFLQRYTALLRFSI